MVPGPVIVAPPENLFNMHILTPTPKPTKLEPLKLQSEIYIFASLTGGSDVYVKLWEPLFYLVSPALMKLSLEILLGLYNKTCLFIWHMDKVGNRC